jgi:hypothetical protein
MLEKTAKTRCTKRASKSELKGIILEVLMRTHCYPDWRPFSISLGVGSLGGRRRNGGRPDLALAGRDGGEVADDVVVVEVRSGFVNLEKRGWSSPATSLNTISLAMFSLATLILVMFSLATLILAMVSLAMFSLAMFSLAMFSLAMFSLAMFSPCLA